MSLYVTPEEIERLMGRKFTDVEHARVELNLASVQQVLEGWCRRKFTAEYIANERHVYTGSQVFLHWGDPVGTVDVRYNSLAEEAVEYTAAQFMESNLIGPLRFYQTMYVSYYNDTTPMQNFDAVVKETICNAVIQTAMLPVQVRYRVINNYSVEGLSVTYGNGASDKTVGQFNDIDLSALAPLRRRLIL